MTITSDCQSDKAVVAAVKEIGIRVKKAGGNAAWTKKLPNYSLPTVSRTKAGNGTY